MEGVASWQRTMGVAAVICVNCIFVICVNICSFFVKICLHSPPSQVLSMLFYFIHRYSCRYWFHVIVICLSCVCWSITSVVASLVSAVELPPLLLFLFLLLHYLRCLPFLPLVAVTKILVCRYCDHWWFYPPFVLCSSVGLTVPGCS